jgi:uncharacterized protein YndB with AHSA1/START domain
MSDNDKTNAAADERELVITRLFDAPRELVFRAWTEPELMKQWWGTKDVTLTHLTVDLRVGGKIHLCMRSPDGRDAWFGNVFREIVRPERLVMSDYFSNAEGEVISPKQYGMEWPDELTITITFTEENGKTRVTMRHAADVPLPKDERDGMGQGWNEMFDRLARYVTADRSIVVTRVFEAPRELVFDAFTDPRHISEWWGPNGFTVTTHSIDVRPGGLWHYTMHGPDGRDYLNKMLYIEVDRPSRLVYDHITGPLFRSTVTFAPEGSDRTEVTVHMVLESPELREHVVKEFGAIEGLKQTLGRFAEHLAKRSAAA